MIAIIPARGGSKGLPGKNIKELNGKPLIAYTIEAALEAEEVEQVIISTDCNKIAEESLKYGAEVPFMRPDNLATDTSTSIDVYKYTIGKIEEEQKRNVNSFVVLQPTSPLRTSKHIDEAIRLFEDKEADSVISYCKEDHPIFWHKYINDDGKFEEIFNNNYTKNRQEIKETYYPNGAIYVFKRKLIFSNNYYTDKSYGYLMNRESSVDIDTIFDWDLTKFLINKKHNL